MNQISEGIVERGSVEGQPVDVETIAAVVGEALKGSQLIECSVLRAGEGREGHSEGVALLVDVADPVEGHKAFRVDVWDVT